MRRISIDHQRSRKFGKGAGDRRNCEKRETASFSIFGESVSRSDSTKRMMCPGGPDMMTESKRKMKSLEDEMVAIRQNMAE